MPEVLARSFLQLPFAHFLCFLGDDPHIPMLRILLEMFGELFGGQSNAQDQKFFHAIESSTDLLVKSLQLMILVSLMMLGRVRSCFMHVWL